jgi:ABC-2 type transport system permease protein
MSPSFGRVGVVALRVIRQLKRDRRTIGLIVFAPIVLMILFGYALSGDMSGVAAKKTRKNIPKARRSG